jgi:hypothetical protein
MPKRDDIFPSKYLKAADLNGKPVVVTIERAPLETLKGLDGGEQVKTVLYFKGTKKMLPLNLTNWDAVAEITGEEDTDMWPGHTVEVYPSTTTMGGKTVPCIRIRAPAQLALKSAKPGSKKPPPDNSDMDDQIPF